jgi:hypothetical protein
MTTETLLPLVTFILGLAGALVAEAFRDRRASNRELQARQAELQRTTLLNLQDTLLDLANLAREARLAAVTAPLQTSDEAVKWFMNPELRQFLRRLGEASDKIHLLVSRVQDDEARLEVRTFLDSATGVGNPAKKTVEEQVEQIGETYRKAIERLGKLLRERY